MDSHIELMRKDGMFSLYHLVKYLGELDGLNLRHNDIRNKVTSLSMTDMRFRTVEEETVWVRGRAINTFVLDRAQTIIVASNISPKYLLVVIDRLNSLERMHEDTTTQEELVKGMKALSDYVNDGKIPRGVMEVETAEMVNGVLECKFYYEPGKYINTVFPGSMEGVKAYED